MLAGLRSTLLLIVALLLLPRPVLAMPLPDCAGTVEDAHAPVARVEKNGTLVLANGHAVLLEGVRLPGVDRPGDPIAARALDTLRALTVGKSLTLTTTAPQQDRYGHLRVQAFTDVWLQVELLKRGLARVAIMPDRQECSPDFYDAEIEARNAGRGLWALPAFEVRGVQGFSAPDGSFQIVEGRVANVSIPPNGRAFLDFDSDFRKGFSAVIAPDDRKAFRDSDPALADLNGHDVRIRGTVTNFNGRPEIMLFNPRQIELVK